MVVEVESTDVVLESEKFVWCRVEPVRDVRPFDDTGVRPVTRGDRDLVPSPSYYPVNLGSRRQSLRSGVRLQSRLLTRQTTDLPE